MKRIQLIAMFTGAIVLTSLGNANIAEAQSRKAPNIIENLAVRVCNPISFDEILKTDFRGIQLNQRQNETILQSYNSYLNWGLDNLGQNTCFKNGTIQANWLREYYRRYEAVVRQTLNQRQLQQWDRNVQASLRSRK